MREFMAITKALSDPNRVRILLALRRGELCVCQITELFGFAPSTVSKHLSILHHAGLILVAQNRTLGLLPAAGQVRARWPCAKRWIGFTNRSPKRTKPRPTRRN